MTTASKLKQTLASLKNVQGTLRVYSTRPREEESQKVFEESLEVTAQVIGDLEKRLKEMELQEPQYQGN
ncbi:MAG: DUF1657 domain-containing protein [Candidatus Syntrophonatronum acetioxidans]|uniref:DUF1657 domain-containing protein n=1 Tax=Candidatus Syntrophonatronum acetioxidans TaxID=1795816 RepID=A0A424Y9H8_9FIRM|nr:MAG: DUF1657 domain-containing protein [Candidatus Syntrophonatronum acetioxidans]